MIDLIQSWLNPLATLFATVVSASLLIFEWKKYQNRKPELVDVFISDAEVNDNGKTSFHLKCMNDGLDDLYITDLYVSFEDEDDYIKYVNGQELGKEGTSLVYQSNFNLQVANQ